MITLSVNYSVVKKRFSEVFPLNSILYIFYSKYFAYISYVNYDTADYFIMYLICFTIHLISLYLSS